MLEAAGNKQKERTMSMNRRQFCALGTAGALTAIAAGMVGCANESGKLSDTGAAAP